MLGTGHIIRKGVAQKKHNAKTFAMELLKQGHMRKREVISMMKVNTNNPELIKVTRHNQTRRISFSMIGKSVAATGTASWELTSIRRAGAATHFLAAGAKGSP